MSSRARDDLSCIVECLVRVEIILIEFLWLSLVGECLMAHGDGQGPPLGVLHLVVPGPLGSSSFFYFAVLCTFYRGITLRVLKSIRYLFSFMR